MKWRKATPEAPLSNELLWRKEVDPRKLKLKWKQKYSEMPTSERSKSGKWWNLDGDQFGFQTVLSVQNPNWAYPDALYALACPVRYVVESSIQTAVRNLDVYKPDASQTSKIQTSSDFGTSLYTTYIVTNEKSGDSRLDIEICIWMQSFWKAIVIWSPTKFFRNSELWNSSSLDRSSLKSLKLFVFVSLCIAKSKKWQR